jgi:hypothetical protein
VAKFSTRVFKSPFEKGGFRGIIKRLFNPPYPPSEKGGKYWPLSRFFLNQKPAYLSSVRLLSFLEIPYEIRVLITPPPLVG